MSLKLTQLDNANILLEINNVAVPDLNLIDICKAQCLVEHSVVPGQAVLEGKTVGAIVVLSGDCGFQSDYYR
jgi:hypothetical protein